MSDNESSQHGRPEEGRVLGVDLGTRRVGIAVSDSRRNVGLPHAIWERGSDEDLFAKLRAVIEELDVNVVVVGMPLSLSGEQGPAARSVEMIVTKIREALTVAVETIDERLTSVQVATGHHSLVESARRPSRGAARKRQPIDDQAAAVIVQSFLDQTRARK